MVEPSQGYREIEHTADWELEVWAPDLAGLLEQAARGMYILSSTHLEPGPRLQRFIEKHIVDKESVLVSFLAELLWFGEQDGLGFDSFDLRIENDILLARLEGAPIASQSKEIKAITYHNLAIRLTDTGLTANIVFDV